MIYVLLILAGISISMLSGDNGILTKATDAKTKTERQSIVEQARTDVLGYQAENKGGDLDKAQLKSVLDTYFKEVPKEEDLPDGEELLKKEFTTLDKYGTHTIKVSEIYNGNFINKENNAIDWDSLFTEAINNPEKYKHSDQTTDTRIAFGKSGKPVNLDLWNITGDDNGYKIVGFSTPSGGFAPPTFTPGYLGNIGSDGIIHDEMPMYVQSNTNINSFIPVISVDMGTFVNMSELKELPEFATTIKEIGWEAFKGCTGLTSITIPNDITSIGINAFYNCTNLYEITIPDSLMHMDSSFGNTMWYNAQPDGIVYLQHIAYGYKGFPSQDETLVLKNGTTAIASGAFMYKDFSNVVLPEGIKVIDFNAFLSCTYLNNVIIPSTAIEVNDCFGNCASLTNITVLKEQNSLAGSPWGALDATITWNN